MAMAAAVSASPFLQVRLVSDSTGGDSERMTIVEQTPSGKAEVLFVRKAVLMNESSVAGVATSMNGATHLGMIQLQLNDAGRKRLAEITRQNIGHRLAIILDGRLYCAPVVEREMTGGLMMVTGDFDHAQSSALAAKLSERLRWDYPDHISAPQTGARPPIDTGEPAPRGAAIPPPGNDSELTGILRASRSTRLPNLPPRIVWKKPVKGPVAVKALADGSIYVLNDHPPAFQWFNSNGTVRASFDLTQFHPAPLTANGFDVDDKGNAYVAMTSLNEVLMLRPSGNGSYAPVIVFENGPELALRAPWDVAVTPDGSSIYVSDSGNHRVARLIRPFDAIFIKNFSNPRGLCLNGMGEPMVADPGSRGLYSVMENNIFESFLCPGALKVSATSEVIYVTDGVSVKQYDSEAFVLLREIPASMGLKNPRSVSAWPVEFEQRVYIADYGNNRVVGVSFTRPDPIEVWNDLKKAVASHDLPRALSYFSADSVDKYKAEFEAVGLTGVAKMLGQATDVKLVSMSDDYASCSAVSLVDGKKMLFYINFSNENGTWKIDSF